MWGTASDLPCPRGEDLRVGTELEVQGDFNDTTRKLHATGIKVFFNDNVRMNSRGWELTLTQSPNDERYKRVRDAAVALMPKMFEGMDPAEVKMFSEALAPPSTIVSFPRAFG